MISENKFKQNLLHHLKQYCCGWVDGDTEISRQKTCDLINHKLKIAVEIKDDTKYNFLNISKLKRVNELYSDHIRSAHKKFECYPEYKTILIFRSAPMIESVIGYTIQGLLTFSKRGGQLECDGRVGKYSGYIRKQIGCFLILTNNYYYLANQHASSNRSLSLAEAEDILNVDIKEIK